MRCAVAIVVVLFVSVVHGEDEVAKATATFGGKKIRVPEKEIASGVKATTALLESCHDKSDGTLPYSIDDLTKAQKGDHVRLVFAKPVTVTVLGKKLEVSEVVFTQPLNTGVFWLRCGDKIVRCSKYEYEKEEDFIAWRNKTMVAE